MSGFVRNFFGAAVVGAAALGGIQANAQTVLKYSNWLPAGQLTGC